MSASRQVRPSPPPAAVATERILPYGRQSIDEADIAAVAEVLRGDWLTTGPAVAAFEAAVARAAEVKGVVACSSGTAALHLALLALAPEPGAIAIVPSITFVATANAARYVGMDVVFADVDPNTGLMTPDTFLDACRRAPAQPRVVLPVDLAGQSVDKPALARLAAERGIAVIDDSSHAFGTWYADGSDWLAAGSCRHAQMTVFSFHPVKNITMGEGGAVTTNDPALAESLRRLRSHGIVRAPVAADGSPQPWHYDLESLGYNYRATDIQCALGLSQLTKLESFRARRAALVRRYDELLAPLAPMVRPLGRVAGCRPFWHLYVAHVDFAQGGRGRGAVMEALRARGIGSQVHYIPVHTQPYYRDAYGEMRLPGADRYYAGALSLPLFVGMADEDVDRVAAALTDALA